MKQTPEVDKSQVESEKVKDDVEEKVEETEVESEEKKEEETEEKKHEEEEEEEDLEDILDAAVEENGEGDADVKAGEEKEGISNKKVYVYDTMVGFFSWNGLLR